MIYAPVIYVRCDGRDCEQDITYMIKQVTPNELECMTSALHNIIQQNPDWTIVALDQKVYCPNCADQANYQ